MHRFIILLLSVATLTARAGANKWPGVEYKTVKVYLYNLDDRLFGQHQPVKNNALDTSIVEPGVTLDEKSIAEAVKLGNENTNVLELGLAGCYIPHHAIVFFDVNNKPVAWISMCFMCDGARFFPYKKLNEKEKFTPAKEKIALNQVDRLKKIVASTGLPIYAGSPEFNAHARMLRKPATDSVEIDWKGFTNQFIKSYKWAKNAYSDFSSCRYQIDSTGEYFTKNNIVPFTSVTFDSTVKIAGGGRHYYFFGVESPYSNVNYSKAHGNFLPDYARITERCFSSVINQFTIGMYRISFNQLLEKNNIKTANTNRFTIADEEAHLKYRFIFEKELLKEIRIDRF